MKKEEVTKKVKFVDRSQSKKLKKLKKPAKHLRIERLIKKYKNEEVNVITLRQFIDKFEKTNIFISISQ